MSLQRRFAAPGFAGFASVMWHVQPFWVASTKAVCQPFNLELVRVSALTYNSERELVVWPCRCQKKAEVLRCRMRKRIQNMLTFILVRKLLPDTRIAEV